MFDQDKNLIEKWSPVLEHTSAVAITDPYKRAVTARLLENQEIACREERAQQGFQLNEVAANATGGSVAGFDPVLISLVRRAMPNLIAYDIKLEQKLFSMKQILLSVQPVLKKLILLVCLVLLMLALTIH